MSFRGSGSPGSSPYMACSHSCEMDCLGERHQGSKESYNEREKTALRCMRAEIELSQPQFYGTSSLLGRIALTGLFVLSVASSSHSGITEGLLYITISSQIILLTITFGVNFQSLFTNQANQQRLKE